MTPSPTLPKCLTAAAQRRLEAIQQRQREAEKAREEIDLDARRRELWRDM